MGCGHAKEFRLVVPGSCAAPNTPHRHDPTDTSLDEAVAHLCSVQHADGRWEGEMVWNTMLLSQYVLTHRIVGDWPLSEPDRAGIRRHYETTRLDDGSWPIHSDGLGSVYVTALAYVSLRVLGVSADGDLISGARRWLRDRTDAVLSIPSWGRMWLAMLGLYEYEGINPVPPEMMLLPRWVPVRPDRMYCHTRYVYLGLAYLYARRVRVDLGALGGDLRQELYQTTYESIDFRAARRRFDDPDIYAPPSRLLRIVYSVLAWYERKPSKSLRRAAIRRCNDRVSTEAAASDGHGLSPVNAFLGVLVLADSGEPAAKVREVLNATSAWRWEDNAQGIRIVGARSSAWDTAFAMRALLSAPSSLAVRSAIASGYRWLADAQASDELPEDASIGRDPIKGGWCFSEGSHRWPVSDCTAEVLRAILTADRRPELATALGSRLSDVRIIEAVEFVMARQNRDGGFGTYERARSPRFVERLNPSEMYANCMTDQSHLECSASCVGALAQFHARYPDYRSREIDDAIRRGVRFIRSRQRPDGSFEGAWGINFCYATFFAVEALTAVGVDGSDPALANAASWLIGKQKQDGGWGEHYTSCLTGEYVEHPDSQAAMTAWAVLALVPVVGKEHPAVIRGAQCLLELRRESSGRGWPQQAASGVFFATAVLDYRLYKDIFPTWALTRAAGTDSIAPKPYQLGKV
jgi:squalene/oxidosqualene cyclase-like protein